MASQEGVLLNKAEGVLVNKAVRAASLEIFGS